MAGLQPGQRVPNFRRADAAGVAQVFYELHYGQPMVLAILPDDVDNQPWDLLRDLAGNHPVWERVGRLALRNADPQSCAAFLEQLPLDFPLLADDHTLTAHLTGRERQADLVLLALDRNLRLLERLDVKPGDDLPGRVEGVYARLEEPEPLRIRHPAPVLVLPRVFTDAFCDELIGFFDADGGHESGVLYMEGGKERWAPAPDIKSRRDVYIRDEIMAGRVRDRLRDTVLPEIERCFQFQVKSHEPWKLVRYGGEKPGYFRPHRDNVTRDVAHRRFAMTLNLNEPESYEGGRLRFPEHGPHLYQPPRGGAIVFSCSLVHEATEVTRGTRYALLGFFY